MTQRLRRLFWKEMVKLNLLPASYLHFSQPHTSPPTVGVFEIFQSTDILRAVAMYSEMMGLSPYERRFTMHALCARYAVPIYTYGSMDKYVRRTFAEVFGEWTEERGQATTHARNCTAQGPPDAYVAITHSGTGNKITCRLWHTLYVSPSWHGAATCHPSPNTSKSQTKTHFETIQLFTS